MNEVGAEKALGKAIQDARKKAGLTQQELCQKTGISYSTLAKIERGAIKAPSVFTVANIASVTDCSVEDLVSSSAAQNTPQKTYLRSKSGIEFVFFDINGCMVRFFQRAFTAISEATGTSPDIVEDTFWRHNDAVCRGEMTIDDFNKALAERLNVTSIDWREYYLDNIEIIPEAQEVLRWASENYRVGLLSNIMPGLIESMLERGILPKLNYQAIVDSSQIGAIKPEAQIYQIAAEKSGVPSENILLVDDARPNLMAAQTSGWHVMWFDDFRPEESVERIKRALEV